MINHTYRENVHRLEYALDLIVYIPDYQQQLPSHLWVNKVDQQHDEFFFLEFLIKRKEMIELIKIFDLPCFAICFLGFL
jgi:hypothetical protein